MRILLTNDDGVAASGLRALAASLCQAGHEVTVIAPASEQSGVSSSLSLHAPLRVTEFNELHEGLADNPPTPFRGYTISGTPVDCVKMGLLTLLQDKPDLVVAGINAGFNIGMDVLYSGTVGAAMEALCMGYPAFAISRGMHADDDPVGCARIAAQLVDDIDWKNLPKGRLLNLNFPRMPLKNVKGLKVCPVSKAPWISHYERREDPRGKPYWWIAGLFNRYDAQAECDCALAMEGWMTLSAIKVDVNDADLNAQLEKHQK